MIEQRAKSVLRKINTIQFSRVDEEAQRHGFPLIMKAISAAGGKSSLPPLPPILTTMLFNRLLHHGHRRGHRQCTESHIY